MRPFFALAAILSVLVSGAAYAVCPGSTADLGYPCVKSWQGIDNDPGPIFSPGNQLTTTNANGNTGYPGWTPVELGGGGGTVAMTILGDSPDPALPCERDTIGSSQKRKYRSDNISSGTYPTWAIAAGDTLSLYWRIYVKSDGSTQPTRGPMIKLQNNKLLRLDFMANAFRNGLGSATPAGGVYSGWFIQGDSTPTNITGGAVIQGTDDTPNTPATRFLPMSMDRWHTLRIDLLPDNGSGQNPFKIYLDAEIGITSSRQYMTGVLTAAGNGDHYVQFGLTDSAGGRQTDYATAYIAWGKNAEIPAVPSIAGMVDCDANPNNVACIQTENTLDACRNGLDDDGDGLIDCDDPDCAALAHCANTAPEFVVTSVRQMGFGEAVGNQNNLYFSVYDENGNTLPNVTIHDPKSPGLTMGAHNDNQQAGHYRYIQLNVDGRKSYRFHVYADNGSPVSSEVTPELFQTNPEVGWGWLIEFMKKSQRTNAGTFTPTPQTFNYDGVQFNQFNIQPNLSLSSNAVGFGTAGSNEFIQTFKIPVGVSRIVSARVMMQIGFGNGGFQYRLTVHQVTGNNPPQTPADLGPQIGAARLSALIQQDAAAWQDQIVVWPVSGLNAVSVSPGLHYALKIVRVDNGTGAPNFNVLRTTSNWISDVVSGNDRIEFLALSSGSYVLQSNSFDARAYIVGGQFGPADPCSHPVFDVASQVDSNPDSYVDSFDFFQFTNCDTGANAGLATFNALSQQCKCMDIDCDKDVDLDDFAKFQTCYQGGAVPADPTCDGRVGDPCP